MLTVVECNNVLSDCFSGITVSIVSYSSLFSGGGDWLACGIFGICCVVLVLCSGVLPTVMLVCCPFVLSCVLTRGGGVRSVFC